MELKSALGTGKILLVISLKAVLWYTLLFRYTSSFGDCSEDCGPGKFSRRVFCIKDGAPVAPSECPEDLQPLEEEDCDNNCTVTAEASGDNATEASF